MENERFIQADIYSSSAALDGITGALTDYGITGFIIQDGAEYAGILDDKDAAWDYVDDKLLGLRDVEPHVTFYVHDNAQGAETLAAVRSYIGACAADNADGFYGNIRMELANVKEEDWANNWKKYYKPFRVGKSIVIKPSWEEFAPQSGDKILEIDPASTFGTGQHNTTRMVIETLEEIIHGGERVLDLGCGSGILSIASMLLGGGEVSVCDIFENAVKTAHDNLLKNNVPEDKVHAFLGNIVTDEKLRENIGGGFDVVCANIVADVIIAMSGIFGGFMKGGGRLIVSGIIDERLSEVIAALEGGGFAVVSSKNSEGWNCVILKKQTGE